MTFLLLFFYRILCNLCFIWLQFFLFWEYHTVFSSVTLCLFGEYLSVFFEVLLCLYKGYLSVFFVGISLWFWGYLFDYSFSSTFLGTSISFWTPHLLFRTITSLIPPRYLNLLFDLIVHPLSLFWTLSFWTGLLRRLKQLFNIFNNYYN